MIPAFESLGWFTVTGRGDAAAVELDRDCNRSDLLEIFKRVMIDGIEYDVIGVETNAVEQQRKGWKIGLLVGTRAPRS